MMMMKKDLETLKREYKHMECNRKSFNDEINLVLKRQQQSLTKLRNENENLKTDIASLRSKTTIKPIAATVDQKSMNKIQCDMDKFATSIEIEKNRINQMEEEIDNLKKRIWDKRLSMGGVNAARENQRLVEKQIRILENRLDQALVKYNKSVAQNRSVRTEIDDLRGERLSFDIAYKKLEKELHEKKKQLSHVIEQSNISYEQRDKSKAEISSIEQSNRKEQSAFDQQVVELGKVLEEGMQALAVKHAEAQARLTSAANETARKTSSKGANNNVVSREKGMLQVAKEKVQNFEEAFRKIASATGIEDIDELTEAFIANEEQNFSLFSYANEQANEVDRLEEQVKALKEENERYERENGNDISQYEQSLKTLREKVDDFESQTFTLEKKHLEASSSLNRVKNVIQSMLIRLDCPQYNGSGENNNGSGPITEVNMIQFLGIIEDRTNDIVSIHNKFSKKNGTDPHTSASISTISSPNILGIGPTAPMGSEPIIVSPPKVNDYSSDEGGSAGDEVESSSFIRPLTREELHSKTYSKSIKRKIKKPGTATRRGSVVKLI